MEETGMIGIVIIVANVIASYLGFRDDVFLDKYSFRVDEILVDKDYKRLVTLGFLHVSWAHLIFNMLTLYFFSSGIEAMLGETKFLLIYLSSLIGGNLFALFIHRNQSDYSSVGASGAISGIVFASIALFPGMQIGFFGLPFFIPSWVYGLLYVLYSIYGIKSQRDNTGHEAHLGGGLVGLLIALAMVPSSLTRNYLHVLLILIPSLVFIYLIITRPEFLLVDKPFQKAKGFQTFEDKYNSEKRNKEKELDKLLDKIGRKGMDSLTSKEKEKLKQLSKVK